MKRHVWLSGVEGRFLDGNRRPTPHQGFRGRLVVTTRRGGRSVPGVDGEVSSRPEGGGSDRDPASGAVAPGPDDQAEIGGGRSVGVVLLDVNLSPVADFRVGTGIRPSIAWAGDRWIVRYSDSTSGNAVTAVAGSMQGTACGGTACVPF